MGMLQLRAKDGHNLSAYMVAPEGKPRGGVVVIQEIFGLNSHIKRVTEQYAGLGDLAVAPALFDRSHQAQRRAVVQRPAAGHRPGDEDDQRGRARGRQRRGRCGCACRTHRHGRLLLGRTRDVPGRQSHQHRRRRRLLRRRHRAALEPVPRCPMQFHFGERTRTSRCATWKDPCCVSAGRVPHLRRGPSGFNCTDRRELRLGRAPTSPLRAPRNSSAPGDRRVARSEVTLN